LIPSQQDRPPASEPQPATSVTTRPSLDTANLAPPSLASTTSGAASPNDARSSSKKTKKKKTNSVLSFLSLKEPSQSALDQFAEQQRKQAAGKSASTSLSKSSGNYVNQKLPKTVPKVNSKWDGVPGVKSTHYSTPSASTKGNRRSLVSPSSWTSPIKSLARNDSDSMHNRFTSPPPSESSQLPRSDSSIGYVSSVVKMPKVSYYTPNAPTEAFSVSPSIPVEEETSSRELPSPFSDSLSETRPSTDEPADSRAVSPDSSTDSVNTLVRDTAETIFRKLNDQPHQDLFGDDAYAVQPAGTVRVPESHDFLFDVHVIVERRREDKSVSPSSVVSSTAPHYAPAPPVHNFSRPMSWSGPKSQKIRSLSKSSYRRRPSASALPTVYEASLASSTESLGPLRENGHGHVDEDANSIAPSKIPSSERFIPWHESPRERLGLGGRLKMNDDLSPWDSQGETRGKLKKSRLSTFLGTRT